VLGDDAQLFQLPPAAQHRSPAAVSGLGNHQVEPVRIRAQLGPGSCAWPVGDHDALAHLRRWAALVPAQTLVSVVGSDDAKAAQILITGQRLQTRCAAARSAGLALDHQSGCGCRMHSPSASSDGIRGSSAVSADSDLGTPITPRQARIHPACPHCD
jgi:hypothetical protein